MLCSLGRQSTRVFPFSPSKTPGQLFSQTRTKPWIERLSTVTSLLSVLFSPSTTNTHQRSDKQWSTFYQYRTHTSFIPSRVNQYLFFSVLESSNDANDLHRSRSDIDLYHKLPSPRRAHERAMNSNKESTTDRINRTDGEDIDSAATKRLMYLRLRL